MSHQHTACNRRIGSKKLGLRPILLFHQSPSSRVESFEDATLGLERVEIEGKCGIHDLESC